MAVIQSKQKDLRFLKRQNLEEEAKVIGNYYRDIISQYGVDCNYYKIKIPYAEYFKPILDHNNVIQAAYGQFSHPDYRLSTDTVTYVTVEDDIFQLNKFGLSPNTDVTFYFDINQFACDFAYCLGQIKEYKIHETEIVVEVPENTEEYEEYVDKDGNTQRYRLNGNIFPYLLGAGYTETFQTDILSGYLSATIDNYELDKEYVVQCQCLQHNEANVSFPVNPFIYNSFDYKVTNRDFLDPLILLKYKVSRIKHSEDEDGNPVYKNVLRGTLYGAVLFRDINRIGKYLEKIHPEVGDIVTIDFPDNKSRQQYEITDCFDTELGNDGINPLLHKYVWKCKARRYIPCGEDFPEKNEANDQIQEKHDLNSNFEELVDKQISTYDEENNDAVYGGYERDYRDYDIKKVNNDDKTERMTFIDDGSYLNLHTFGDGSRLVTDGYELFFVVHGSDDGYEFTKLSLLEDSNVVKDNLVASGIDYLKATDNALYFINFDNKSLRLCEDTEVTQGEIEMCLNSLLETTLKIKDQNKDGDYFYKFNSSETLLFSFNKSLYCRFGNKNHKVVKLA